MSHLPYLSIILIGLIATSNCQTPSFSTNSCSLYCNTCMNISPSSLKYYSCANCPSNFNSTGTDAATGSWNCTLDTDTYEFDMEYTFGSFVPVPAPNNSNNCSAYGLYTPSSGFLWTGNSVTLWNDSVNVAPHYRLRLMASVLFIDNWSSGNNITFKINADVWLAFVYSAATNVSDKCGNSSIA